MFQITNESKIVIGMVANRQESNILGFHVNVLTEQSRGHEEIRQNSSSSSPVSSATRSITNLVRVNDNSKKKNVNIDFVFHPLYLYYNSWIVVQGARPGY